MKESVKKEILSWVSTILAALFIGFMLNQFVLISAEVVSGSMSDTILKGDRLLGTRFSYWFSEPERGDIVVFQYPVDAATGVKTNYIKRVIGLPGETVEIKNAHIYIDGSKTPLEENYLKEEWIVENDGYTFEIPEDSYLMLGDNRNNSLDSRYWASEAIRRGITGDENDAMKYSFVKKKQILGKAFVRYWPVTEIKTLK